MNLFKCFPLWGICGVFMLLSCTHPAATSDAEASKPDTRSHQLQLFEDGNYAMFIHFGLYSNCEAEWKGKAYYGNAEWIMNDNVAGIPVDEYMATASDFNPSDFNADSIVAIAKDAGMKYIVITSKHHEGFAMFKSDYSKFNIQDATPFGRDVIGELAAACHREGIGIGFYYSQFQDWTTPGGGNGPQCDSTGRKVSFDEYFREKCVPQVNEITTKYGEIELIWFDTPGNMDAKYSRELVDLVHKNQPGALVSSRVGNNMGDYESLGDMEVPVRNVEGLWEGIDVMQVGWGFSKFDNEWKTPEFVLRELLSTIARGGTFMMNVGPTAKGIIPQQAAQSLRKAGQWIRKYPKTVYGAGPSPFQHALPWGDAVTQGNKLYLLVYEWPRDGKLVVPGLKTAITEAKIYDGMQLRFSTDGDWTTLNVPYQQPEEMVSVIELTCKETPDADDTQTIIPEYPSVISTAFAQGDSCKIEKGGYMVRFGEWRTQWNAFNWTPETCVTWTIGIPAPGYYNIDLEYRGTDQDKVEWVITSDEGHAIQDKQPAYTTYTWQRMGWMPFTAAGRHTLAVKVIDGDFSTLQLTNIRITKVNL